MAPAPPETGFETYGEGFYAAQLDESLRAARLYSGHLAQFYRPQSVIDLGCGRGAWLKAFGEIGANRLVGIDGPWNSADKMVDPAIAFRAAELEKLSAADFAEERFDLAISVEVAEHLTPGTEQGFVDALCAAADVVLFGAAIPHQPGSHHVNMRWQSVWAGDFAARGFAAYDLFRPAFWGDPQVPYWYQQNSFLYVRETHALAAILADHGIALVTRLETLDAVHPELLHRHAEMPTREAASRLARQLLPPRLFAALKRLRR